MKMDGDRRWLVWEEKKMAHLTSFRMEIVSMPCSKLDSVEADWLIL